MLSRFVIKKFVFKLNLNSRQGGFATFSFIGCFILLFKISIGNNLLNFRGKDVCIKINKLNFVQIKIKAI